MWKIAYKIPVISKILSYKNISHYSIRLANTGWIAVQCYCGGLIALLLLLVQPATAQLCTNSLGSPVVNNTFGQAPTPSNIIGPALPPGRTNLIYAARSCPGGDGVYTILTSTPGCGTFWGAMTHDHTYELTGAPLGYYMQVDASSIPNNFYVDTVSGLCSGTTYQFAAWLVNIYRTNGQVNPNVSFTIEKLDGTVLSTYTTGPIPPTYPGTNTYTWQQYSLYFTTPAGINTVVLRLRNNASGGNGNDLALDDITFRPAGPNIAIAAPGSVNNMVSTCLNNPVTMTATVDNCYLATAYQWQVSTDGGTTWTSITGANTTTYTHPSSAAGIYSYRLLVAQAGNITTTACRVNSQNITITINAAPAVSVSLTAPPLGTICPGTLVTFTATPVNGGTAPAYQWKVNGMNVGINSPTYTNNTLVNGDVITVIMTSSTGCSPPVGSNSITMTLNPAVTPVMSIVASPAGPICSGSSVVFTATPVNGGTVPAYQWKVNGVNAGTNNPVFITGNLSNGDVITCVMTSNIACTTTPIATSNPVTMMVTPSVTPSVMIAAVANNVCPGTPVTFTAVPTNGGTMPSYQWKVNNVNAGTNSATFTSTTLANNDIVAVTLTSNITCTTTPTAASPDRVVSIQQPVTPSISISPSSASICAGTTATFTATSTNGGTAPSYQWKVNGINRSTNNFTFTSTTLADGDLVTAVLTSNAMCATTPIATSNAITMLVSAVITPSVIITVNDSTLCQGQAATFTATPGNAGATPAYQWKVNGNNTGSNRSTFTSSSLTNGASVTAVISSSQACPASATSNPITITVNPLPSIIMGPDKLIKRGASVQLMPIITGTVQSYAWTPATRLSDATIADPVASAASTTVYKLQVISDRDCQATATTTVKVIVPVVVPNAFSPNGDGINDVWTITGLADYGTSITELFDRYGRRIYRTYGYYQPWDGTANGKPLPIGTYYYVIDLKNGSAAITGNVTLIR